MEWNEMEWNGMEWNEMEWNGMEWNEYNIKNNSYFILYNTTVKDNRTD